MKEPCRSCDRRETDFGSCRCQAFLLTGDAAETDPVCSLSPDHATIDAIVSELQDVPHPRLIPPSELVYRTNH